MPHIADKPWAGSDIEGGKGGIHMNRWRNGLTIVATVLLMVCPCLCSVEADATGCDSPDYEESIGLSIAEKREALGDAGIETSSMSDQEIELRWGWWANKNLIGEYAWNDPAGINWLLEKAGIDGKIDDIILIGDGVGVVVSGAAYALTGTLLSAGIVGWFIAAGVFVYGAYTSIMQENALEKANLAVELVSQQRNYAVYETTVMWNTVPNGYEVEECRTRSPR